MTTDSITDLLDATVHLIDRIHHACTDVFRRAAGMDPDAPDADRLILDLAREADDLHRRIGAYRLAVPHASHAVTVATMVATDDLITLLTEARDYFSAGNHNAAHGTLSLFDQYAEDLRAACRLRALAQRRRS